MRDDSHSSHRANEAHPTASAEPAREAELLAGPVLEADGWQEVTED